MQRSTATIDLTATQRRVLTDVFAGFPDLADRTSVFGSRVRGKARPGSDIDLVVYGDIAARRLDALRRALDQSDLSLFVDVVGYAETDNQMLRDEIDRDAVPLFEGAISG